MADFPSSPMPAGGLDAATAHDPGNGQFTSGGGSGSSGKSAEGSARESASIAKGYREDKDGVHTPEGTTLQKPRDKDSWIVRAKKGSEIRGTTYYQPTYLNLSSEFAKHHVSGGNADMIWKPKPEAE